MKEPLVNFTQMSGGGSGGCESEVRYGILL